MKTKLTTHTNDVPPQDNKVKVRQVRDQYVPAPGAYIRQPCGGGYRVLKRRASY